VSGAAAGGQPGPGSGGPAAGPPQGAPVPDAGGDGDRAAAAARQEKAAAGPPPGGLPPDPAGGATPPPEGGAKEGGRGAREAAGDEYAERGRAGVTQVFITDNRSFGVYAEGTITARDVSGRDTASGPGAGPGAGQAARVVSVVAVATQDLGRLRRVAVSAGPRGRATAILERDRLVVLHGPDGVGKGAAGLGLLGLDREVLAVDPSLTARDLADLGRRLPYGRDRQYLVEALPAATAAQLSGFVLRAAARDLESAGSRLVVTVDDRIPLGPELAGWVVSWPDRPDVALALRAHLEYYLGDAEAAAVEERYDLSRLHAGLAARALRSVDEVARAAAEAFRAGRPFESLLGDLGFDAPARAARWFAAAERSPGDLGLLLSVAVLGGCPYSTVARHSERLEELIAGASRIKLSRQPVNPLRPRSQRLRDAMAVLEPGFVDTEYGQSPAETARLESRWLVLAVLGAVWTEYDLLGGALLSWLRETGDDPDPGVRLRAAAAAGWLSQYDFAELRGQLFLPWARGSSQAAWAAADALGQAAWLDATAPLALAMLDVWASQDEDYDLWWTAAVAYGGEAGVRYTGVAMDHLQAIAAKPDDRAPQVVAHSLVRLAASGGRFAPQVAAFALAHMSGWPGDSPAVGLTAQGAYAEMLRRAGDPDWPSSRQYWQLLAAPDSLGASARLLRAVLAHRAFRDQALESVETLARAGDHDKSIREDLAALLTRVAAAGKTDRDRLAHYLSRWAGGSEPSPGALDLADRLREVTVP
jgi:hypothetical protein